MVRLIVSVIVILMFSVGMTGCASGKKSYNEKRGLMLLENSQLGRNKGYYSKHGERKINKGHKKIQKNRKFI